ncbi:MAG: S8 family serine peptidase [Xanthomonadales bacterium]|nr:S8 family serine peptidase [Xanthomonadales bacterium]NIN58670.1 S8 family serine peptidase [Xanthomonadales bacterium]NIN74520.1 S8 family serine peptidase [Xanthomonadales bacterium]NIO14825.1 S8 family serine peptidase [Xanthomonadales bacterium]NIP11063.1 S8 family serine peptidase [Xanthomonadales bacterium]
MNKLTLNLGLALAILCASCGAWAQSEVGQATRQAKLLELAETLQQRDAYDRQQALQAATKLGIPLRRELPNGTVLELQRIVPGVGPIFYVTNNVDAADTVSTDEVWPGGSAGLNLDGAGLVVGEWDGGAVFDAHPDFAGRLTQVDGAGAYSNHSTHVAGTLAGAGDWLYAEARGMAYAAQLNAWDWNSDTAEMAAAAAGGLLISNHSYGIAAGWLYMGGLPPDTWWWIGGENNTDLEDPNFGYYDTETQLWDQIAFDAPQYLIVKAAGNDRSDTGPAPGEEYTVIDQNGNFLFTSTLPRPPDCAPAGYDCLPTNSVAKNVLTVGAVDDLPGGYSPLSGPNSVLMSPFSSWGPTDDGRIKPDLVGNGVFLLSTWVDSPYYAVAAGTSMAAPNVTGSLLLMQEHYQDTHGPGSFLRGASLKALAIHTADEAGGADGPDYAFGWGLLNAKAAAEVITGDGADHRIIEASLANGATDSVEISVTNPDAALRATLVWADPPGTPPAPALDPADLMLVNDLDLRIGKGPTTWQPWVLNPAAPADAATTGDNIRDNVEQVLVSGGGTGTFVIEVSHKGTLLDAAAQHYSLIISIETPPPTNGGLLVNENFSGGLPAGWSVDTLSGVSWTVNSPVPGDPRLDNLTGGAGNFAMVDNGWVNRTYTSLVMPEFDLSANTGVVLRFNSAFGHDTYESINVDLSTNGGSSWSNVWMWQGFNPFPTPYSLDLSNQAAGQPSVILRFRFDSHAEVQGDYWQIDDVQLEVFGGGGGGGGGDAPGLASNPSPADGATGVDINADLSWSAGSGATSHIVFFGTDATPDETEEKPEQGTTSFEPGTLAYSTTYYWKVDEVNANGTTTGAVWSFTTGAAPSKVHVADIEGAGPAGNGNRWHAQARVTVSSDGAPESGVLVEGSWSSGTNGSGSCTTDGAGQCTIERNNIRNASSVLFTVDNLSKSGFEYDSNLDVLGELVINEGDQFDVGDLFPTAVDDNYATSENTELSGVNVLDNDDLGDGGTVTGFDAASALGGSVSITDNGDLSYTPPADTTGTDTFGYTLTDADGDFDTATVTVEISGGGGGGGFTLSVTPYKVKGVHTVDLSWSGATSGSVDICRDGGLIGSTANSGADTDSTGNKGGGVTYVYQVCEAEPDVNTCGNPAATCSNTAGATF